jgi:hypothetical protein
MLSSIHPLGERARANRWGVTVAAFAAGATGAGALLGLLAALVGAATRLSESPVGVPVVVLGVAALLEVAGVPVPTPHRQVNERWIGTYRGWVYGIAFGAQLGAGFATYVVTWAVPALVLTIAWLGDPTLGTAVGAVFGIGRTLPVLAAGWIDRPDRLSTFNRGLAGVARSAHVTGAASLILLAVSAGVIV